MYIKRDDDEYDEHDQDKSNLRRKAFKHSCKKRQLSAQCYGILGVFQRGNLRIIESDQEFASEEIMEEEKKILSDDVIQAIKIKRQLLQLTRHAKESTWQEHG